LVENAVERDWIDVVHGPSEQEQLAAYDAIYTRRRRVHEAMDTGERAFHGELIRDVDTVNVIIAHDPEELNFSGRFEGKRIGWPRMLGVPRNTLMRLTEAIDKQTGTANWVAKGAEFSDDERLDAKVLWTPIGSAKELRSQWLVAIHPNYANYDPYIGLRLGQAGPQQKVRYDELPPIPRYSYKFEPWDTHAQRVVDQASDLCRHYPCSLAAVARWASKIAGSEISQAGVWRWIELTCGLHDIGKLNIGWQDTGWRWQRDKDARLRACGIDILERPAVCLAHTEFDGEEDWKFKNLPGYHFPPHAVEGAFSAAQIVCETAFSTSGPKLGRLVALGILSAIARHHGPRSSRLQPFQMHPLAKGLIAPWISGTPGSLANSPKSEDFEQLVRFGEADQAAVWVLYTLLIRLLRLADQGSLS